MLLPCSKAPSPHWRRDAALRFRKSCKILAENTVQPQKPGHGTALTTNDSDPFGASLRVRPQRLRDFFSLGVKERKNMVSAQQPSSLAAMIPGVRLLVRAAVAQARRREEKSSPPKLRALSSAPKHPPSRFRRVVG